jgi:hypothetical protein
MNRDRADAINNALGVMLLTGFCIAAVPTIYDQVNATRRSAEKPSVPAQSSTQAPPASASAQNVTVKM